MADYIAIIYNLAEKLRFTKVTVCKAAVMCHQFYSRTSEDKYDVKYIAASAVSLAMRLNKEKAEHQAKIVVLYELLNGKQEPAVMASSLKAFEKDMIRYEIFLFKMLEGNVSHKVALEFLTIFLKSIRLLPGIEEKYYSICSHSFKVALEMYSSSKCLKYMPETLAAAAVCISLDLFGYSRDNLALCQKFCPFLTIKVLDELTEYMLENSSH